MTRKKTAEGPVDKLKGLAGETVGALEHLGESKSARKADKREAKAQKRELRAARKAAKHDQRVELDDEGRITPKKARNAVRVAKVVLPAVVPVVAPYAVRAASAVRDRYDRYQARRIGVDVEQLGEFTGRGAALHARIAGVADGLRELRDVSGTAEAKTFTGQTEQTLRQLTATVRAAERMPAPRRKAAHRAVAAELDTIEDQLLAHLQRG